MGQFGQSTWNISDISGLKRRPNFDREWLKAKREIWLKFFWERIEEAIRKGLITIPAESEQKTQGESKKNLFKRSSFDNEKMKQLGFVDSEGEGSLNDPNSDHDIVDVDDFQSDDDDD